ncbi:MAG: hypothetical protein ACPLYE_01680 [Candidatus Micrarchaeales archaeon]
MANDEVNFMDLACILKITPDTVLEKFGSQINASFFDASNIAGTLKQKGLIDFTANYPGPNGMVLTEAGKNLINEANVKSAEPVDDLDKSILAQLSGGKRNPSELGASLNLRPKDLALRLYKLSKQEYIAYELKNGNVEVMLTEKGFLTIPQQKVAQVAPQAGASQQGAQGEVPKDHGLESKQPEKKNNPNKVLVLALLVILIFILVFALYSKHII